MSGRFGALVLAVVALLALTPAAGIGHPTQPLDRDHDTIDNPQDNCPDDYNRDQVDTDRDGQPGGSTAVNEGGDACDTDDDGGYRRRPGRQLLAHPEPGPAGHRLRRGG